MYFATLCLCVSVAFAVSCSPRPDFDIVIRGGTVYDGSGTQGRIVDVGINGDRIAALGDLSGRRAGETIDAAGRAVTPGFIDSDSRAGVSLLADGDAESYARQGISTAILGKESAVYTRPAETHAAVMRTFRITPDWSGAASYSARVSSGGSSVNVGTLVPVAGRTAEQRASELDNGALGVVVDGFAPSNTEAAQQATAVGRSLAGTGRIYATTVPDTASPREVLDATSAVATAAGLKHLLLLLNDSPLTREAVEAVVQALRPLSDRGTGISIAVDPFTVEASRLFEWSGTVVGTGAASVKAEGALEPLGSRASFGAFPQLLESARRGQLALQTAVYQATALPAARFGLQLRGELKQGYFADLVVFDPARIQPAPADAASPYPLGIDYVMVNGVFTVRPSGHTGSRPGRVLR